MKLNKIFQDQLKDLDDKISFLTPSEIQKEFSLVPLDIYMQIYY